MDEYNYDRIAFALAGGGGDRSLLPFSLPAYPRFLALVYSLCGRNLLLVRLIQSAIGAGSVLLLYRLGRKIFGEPTGLLAGGLLSLYGLAVFHEGLLVPATLALFLSLAALLFWADERGGFLRGLLGGALLGLAGSAAAANLLFAGFLIVGSIARRGAGAWKAAGAALGAGLVVALFALANYSASGAFVLGSAHGGINFYIGNNPEANGGYKTPVRLTPSASGIIRDSIRIAEEETGRRLSPAETSRFWFGQGLNFIRSSPSAFVRVAGAKLGLLIGRWEHCDVGGVWIGKQETFHFWGMPLLPFFLVGPLGLAGMLLGIFPARADRPPVHTCPPQRTARRRRTGLQAQAISCPGDSTPAGQNVGQAKKRLILYAYAGAQALGIVLYYYQARARLLLIPVLCLFAADTVFAVIGAWRERRYQRTGMILALTLGFILLSASRPWLDMRSEVNVLIMSAQEAAGEGRSAEALGMIARAKKLNPKVGGAGLVEGRIHSLAGDRAKAENSLSRAAQGELLIPDPTLELGFLFLAEKRLPEARREAEKALRIDPLSYRARVLSARIDGEEDDAEGEAKAYRSALELNPNEVEALLNLAGLSAEWGDLREAEGLRSRAERVDPGIWLKVRD